MIEQFHIQTESTWSRLHCVYCSVLLFYNMLVSWILWFTVVTGFCSCCCLWCRFFWLNKGSWIRIMLVFVSVNLRWTFNPIKQMLSQCFQNCKKKKKKVLHSECTRFAKILNSLKIWKWCIMYARALGLWLAVGCLTDSQLCIFYMVMFGCRSDHSRLQMHSMNSMSFVECIFSHLAALVTVWRCLAEVISHFGSNVNGAGR